jgi:GntR family transcriptional regulator
MLVSLDAADATPIYAQVERSLRAAIAAGRLKPGHQLPTVRELAVELKVNANTIARVYSELERAGVFETRRGVGTFVRAGRTEARPASEHAKRLKAFATRVLSEGDTHGFTAEEVIAALKGRLKGV